MSFSNYPSNYNPLQLNLILFINPGLILRETLSMSGRYKFYLDSKHQDSKLHKIKNYHGY